MEKKKLNDEQMEQVTGGIGGNPSQRGNAKLPEKQDNPTVAPNAPVKDDINNNFTS